MEFRTLDNIYKSVRALENAKVLYYNMDFDYISTEIAVPDNTIELSDKKKVVLIKLYLEVYNLYTQSSCQECHTHQIIEINSRFLAFLDSVRAAYV